MNVNVKYNLTLDILLAACLPIDFDEEGYAANDYSRQLYIVKRIFLDIVHSSNLLVDNLKKFSEEEIKKQAKRLISSSDSQIDSSILHELHRIQELIYASEMYIDLSRLLSVHASNISFYVKDIKFPDTLKIFLSQREIPSVDINLSIFLAPGSVGQIGTIESSEKIILAISIQESLREVSLEGEKLWLRRGIWYFTSRILASEIKEINGEQKFIVLNEAKKRYDGIIDDVQKYWENAIFLLLIMSDKEADSSIASPQLRGGGYIWIDSFTETLAEFLKEEQSISDLIERVNSKFENTIMMEGDHCYFGGGILEALSFFWLNQGSVFYFPFDDDDDCVRYRARAVALSNGIRSDYGNKFVESDDELYSRVILGPPKIGYIHNILKRFDVQVLDDRIVCGSQTILGIDLQITLVYRSAEKEGGPIIVCTGNSAWAVASFLSFPYDPLACINLSSKDQVILSISSV